ncbi:hypothetical protein T10_3073 [Trichinella papuae]|uniref:Uncharacterized protein n=1 Tax=Trichinella papuae TaxID=268474 RepID=A0A0V1MZE2_9BILA|nr:hypothetical protein T10_3073 [Trichinella papuae]
MLYARPSKVVGLKKFVLTKWINFMTIIVIIVNMGQSLTFKIELQFCPIYYLYMQNDIQILSNIYLLDVALQQMSFFFTNETIEVYKEVNKQLHAIHNRSSKRHLTQREGIEGKKSLRVRGKEKAANAKRGGGDGGDRRKSSSSNKQQQQHYNNVGGICQLLFPTLKKNLRFWLIEGRPVGVMCQIAANNQSRPS